MLIVDDKLVSEELFDKQFVCDLNACKGVCCVEGDAGAPVTDEEADKLEEELENIRPFLRKEGLEAISKEGVFTIDSDGDMVTPLVEGKECAYVVFEENGLASCGIEKAWKAGKTDFRKPISCHLYPVRTAKVSEYTALNYHKWGICSAACTLGEHLKVPVYVFVKDALVRAYGESWYEELSVAAEAWLEHGLHYDDSEA